jgi:hypothetical protein
VLLSGTLLRKLFSNTVLLSMKLHSVGVRVWACILF